MEKNMQMHLLIRIGIILMIIIMLFIAESVLQLIFGEQISKSLIYSLIYVVLSFAVACICAKWLRATPFVILICVVSITGKLIISLWAKTEPASDFALLYYFAESLKNGELDRLTSSSYFLKWGYQSFFVMYEALIISIFPGGVMPLMIFNSLFMTGNVVLIYFISRHLFKEVAAKIVTVLYLFYPAPYFFASVLTNQHISLFFILLGVFLLVRKHNMKYAIIGGCFVAIGNAFRPEGILVIMSIAVLAIIIGVSKRKEKLVGIVKSILPFFACIVTYAIIGILISGIVVISGVNPNGQKNSDPLWKFVLGLNAKTNGTYSGDLASEVFDVVDDSERHSLELDIIKRHLSIRKLDLFEFLISKTVRYWRANEDTNWAFIGQDNRIVPIINKPLKTILILLKRSERIYFAFVVLLIVISLLALWRRKEVNIFIILFGLLITAFFFTYVLVEIQSRYRYFIYPFMFILSGPGIETLSSYSKGILLSLSARNKDRTTQP